VSTALGMTMVGRVALVCVALCAAGSTHAQNARGNTQGSRAATMARQAEAAKQRAIEAKLEKEKEKERKVVAAKCCKAAPKELCDGSKPRPCPRGDVCGDRFVTFDCLSFFLEGGEGYTYNVFLSNDVLGPRGRLKVGSGYKVVMDGGHRVRKWNGAFEVDGELSMRNIFVKNQRAKDGGALMVNKAGHATLDNVEFNKNKATIYGGAIFNAGHIKMTNCTVSQNVAGYGGGLYNTGTLLMSGSRSRLSGNAATYDGGAFYNGYGPFTIEDTSFAGNMANHGGGMYLTFYADILVNATNCEFSRNRASKLVDVSKQNPTQNIMDEDEEENEHDGHAIFWYGHNPPSYNNKGSLTVFAGTDWKLKNRDKILEKKKLKAKYEGKHQAILEKKLREVVKRLQSEKDRKRKELLEKLEAEKLKEKQDL